MGRGVPPGGASRRLPHEASRAVFSALDLGTNNCRLLIARPQARGGFRIIDAFSRVVRLGEGLGQSGRLSPAAMDRALLALDVCARKIERRAVTCMRSVATEACRSAQNCQDFLDRVHRETGLYLDVISPIEEARLAVLGCQALIDPASPYALVFDIGGGSTELIFVARDRLGDYRILAWTSIPWGVVNLSERFATTAMDRPAYEALKREIGAPFYAFEAEHRLMDKIRAHRVQLLGTSGTVTTLASLYLQLPGYDRRAVDGLWIDYEEIKAVAARVSAMSFSDRREHPCIGEDRADLVVAGCIILELILDAWPCDRLRVADRGIREGILRGLMGQGHAVHLPSPAP